MNITHLATKNEKIAGMTLSGFSFKCFVNDDAATTTAGSLKIDFSKYAFKAILNRNGVEKVIMQDNLKILGLASNINTQGQLAFYQGVTDHYTKLGTGLALLGFVIPFGGCVRLTGNDFIYIECTDLGAITTGWRASTSLEIKPIKAVGYETFIPSVKSYAIQAGETSNNYPLGDNVIRAAILNYDITTFLTPAVANISFASDRLSESYTFADLVLAKKISMGKQVANLSADDATIFESDQSFVLVDAPQVFNSVQLSVAFNAANVAASSNYIVVWNYQTDWNIINAASQLQATHQEKAAADVPASVI